MGGFEVRNDIALTVTVCIASLKAIGDLQRRILRQSCASVKLEWTNMLTIPASEELSAFCRSFIIVHAERGQ